MRVVDRISRNRVLIMPQSNLFLIRSRPIIVPTTLSQNPEMS